jgi:poly(3-hydroxybutyrate) depolymerase
MTFVQALLLTTAMVQPPAAAQGPLPGRLVEHVPCPADPTERYTLYLPSAYETTRRWPLLLVFDPGARALRAAEEFQAAAERFGWVVAVSEDSRNGPWEVSQRAVRAMWPALVDGYAIDPARIYAAGHSGGASVAWALAAATGQVAGVIASGQPDPGREAGKPSAFAWFGTAGYDDFNFVPAKTIDARMEASGRPHRLEFFDGGHQWPPTDLAEAALGWMEVTAMKESRRRPDGGLVASLLSADLTRARTLEERGALTEARRSYATIVEAYARLTDVAEARTRTAALDASERLKALRRTEERTDAREHERVTAVERMLTRLAGQEPASLAELENLIDFSSLLKKSRGDDYEARSARRTLALLSAELPSARRQFDASRDFGRAAAALELAATIHPERTGLWIELAAERVLSGQKGLAIAALARAVDAGYDREALRNDARFERLRGTEAFEKIVK